MIRILAVVISPLSGAARSGVCNRLGNARLLNYCVLRDKIRPAGIISDNNKYGCLMFPGVLLQIAL